MKSSTKCVIVNEKDEILLIKRASSDSHAGYWETPGGGIDPGEGMFEAVVREVKEETGLDLKFATFIGTEVMTDDESYEKFNVSLFYATADYWKGSLLMFPTMEHVSAHWVAIDKMDVVRKQGTVDSWTMKHIDAFLAHRKN